MKQLFSLRKISVSVYFVFLPVTLTAGDPYFLPAGASEAGMAYVSVMKTGFWSSFHNQASLSLYRKYSCGINYENRFGIKELGTCSAAISAPAGRASLAGIYSSFGYTDFRRQMAGMACSLPVTGKLSAGIQIDYFSEKAYGEYNNTQILTFEAGLIVSATDNIRIGIHIFNPVPNSLRKNEMASVLTAGIGGIIGSGLFAGVETEMTTSGKIDLRTGFEYIVDKKFILRGGFRTLNSSFSFGTGYRARSVIIEIAFATHDKLGITSSVSLTFNLKN